MTANIGTADRNARAIIGFMLIAASLFGVVGLWGFIGIPLVVTALVNFCPAYQMLGYNTCKAR